MYLSRNNSLVAWATCTSFFSQIYRLINLLLFSLAVFILPQQCFAFYSASGRLGDLDLGVVLRASASAEKFVENSIYSESSTTGSQSSSLRATIDYSPDDQFSIQSHFVLFYDHRKQRYAGDFTGVERSSLFYEQYDSDPITIADVDRLNLSYSDNGLTATIGRQPINLATTFYFSPNDIFAPFAANSFYRIYKPGVDAFRLNKDVGELGQFDFIVAFAYQTRHQTEGGWSQSVDSDRSSLILRYSDVAGSFEWSMLGGQVHENTYLGFGLQGELFDWLGVRAEGQFVDQGAGSENVIKSFTLGFEHHWENSFDLRLEYFFNGFGKKKDTFLLTDLLVSTGQNFSIYPGREYFALGQGYELSPLLFIQILLMMNTNNQAGILSFDFNYSLSDNSELNLSTSSSYNHRSDNFIYNDEFSYSPNTIAIEIRTYF